MRLNKLPKCSYCNKSIDVLQRKCKFCGNIHCSRHLLPEEHRCEGLEEYKIIKQREWKTNVLKYSSKNNHLDLEDDKFENIIESEENLPNKIFKGEREFYSGKNNFLKDVGVFLVLLILIGAAFQFFGLNIAGRITGFVVSSPFINSFHPSNDKIETSPIQNTIYPRWNHMPITYSYLNEQDCFAIRLERVEKAFKIITSLTDSSVTFKGVQSEADINFICHRESNIDHKTNMEIEGEAGVSYLGGEIHHVDIDLYSGIAKECMKFPHTELHEILHAFGVGHNNKGFSVMYPIGSCRSSLNLEADQEIFDNLKVIYNPLNK